MYGLTNASMSNEGNEGTCEWMIKTMNGWMNGWINKLGLTKR